MNFSTLCKQFFMIVMLYAIGLNIYAATGTPYAGLQFGVNAGGHWQLINSAGDSTLFGATGENFGLLGGYGILFRERFYLGAEGFLNASVARTGSKAIDAAGTAVKMRTPYTYGVSIMPGVHITTDTMLFGRAGIVSSRFDITETPITPAVSSTTSNNVIGSQLGLGMALSLSKTLDLRGEYDYSHYQTFTAYGNKISPYTYQLFASFAYKFV
jgi:opacity protein-like surface antigen